MPIIVAVIGRKCSVSERTRVSIAPVIRYDVRIEIENRTARVIRLNIVEDYCLLLMLPVVPVCSVGTAKMHHIAT